MPRERHRGALGGLTIESEIGIPGLSSAASDDAPADVRIVIGRVATSGPGQTIGLDGSLTLDVADVGRFRVDGGRSITVEPLVEPGRESHLRTFLLGTAIGTIFHQRGILPLHASTLQIGDGAVAIAGSSGAGKSTLAHTLVQAGYPLIADDVTPITFADGMPLAWPLLPQVKLWRDALDRAAIATSGLETIADRFDKYRLPTPGSFATTPVPLRAVVVLSDADGDEEVLDPLSGLHCLTTLRAQIYRSRIGEEIRGRDALFFDAGRLASRIVVARLGRRRDTGRLLRPAAVVVKTAACGMPAVSAA